MDHLSLAESLNIYTVAQKSTYGRSIFETFEKSECSAFKLLLTVMEVVDILSFVSPILYRIQMTE